MQPRRTHEEEELCRVAARRNASESSQRAAKAAGEHRQNGSRVMDDEPKSGMRRLAHAIVAVASLVVPRWRRQAWRREWDAELWHAPPGVMRYAAGAIPHALALFQQHWSLDMLAQDLRYGWRSRTFAADEEWQGKD